MSTPKNMASATPNWMHEPFAIVGMACRLPGGDDLSAFWDMLHSGRHGIDRLPEDFFDRSLYFHPEKGLRGKTYSDVGGLIRPRPLDWSIMPIDPATADRWDPCHLLLCEVAAQACRRAGYDPRNLPERRAGVYIGHSGGSTRGGELAYRSLLADYVDLLDDLPEWQGLAPAMRQSVRMCLLDQLQSRRPQRTPDGGPMVDAGFAAGLISRAFGLSGPHMVIDAACASSLVALALSAAALASGQIEMAIVGGASFNKADSLILFSQAQSCSAKASRPFDAAADGLISSEGYVVLVLKTLTKALSDGDRIEAVIRGIGVSSDGRGRSLWAPRKEGQRTAIERAYSSDVTADSIQLVEAHATSTQVGDATEMEALSTFFRQRLPAGTRLPVGSVKSNIGHTLETAGLAGLVKSVLAMQHGIIPPSIGVDQLNETIAWDTIPLFVPRQSLPWPELPGGRPRRAAVNAFGIGGLNVHVVVEQPPDQTAPRPSADHQSTLIRSKPSRPPMPIAVVGRGLVVPGALDVAAFARLLADQTSPLAAPSDARWHTVASPASGAPNRLDRSEVIGGFVSDFAYDWRKHKVPPKQIAQANPLQFMLLEAAEQALREGRFAAGTDDAARERRRQRTAVVVGSVFGGDFGNALYAGLRLPEFRRELASLLQSHGVPEQQQSELLEQYEEHFLKTHPALLDETGSFTSSTLASRLSKTFDLMGGAMAVDAGEASGLAALDAAVNLLRSGTVDHVLCATGQRAMDRASLERLALHDRLVTRSQYAAASPEQRRELAPAIPAEGVALVLLKPLEQALADGDPILATIFDVTAAVDRDCPTSAAARALEELRLPQQAGPANTQRIIGHVPPATSQPVAPAATLPPVKIAVEHSVALETIGNLQAAQGIVDLIECSLDARAGQPHHILTQHALSGLCYSAAVAAGAAELPTKKSEPAMHKEFPSHGQRDTAEAASNILRFEAADQSSLAERLRAAAALAWSDLCAAAVPQFTDGPSWRAAIVVAPGDAAAKLQLLATQLGSSAALVPLAEQGLFWSAPTQRTDKVAWLFPGQGSQYPGMLRDLVGGSPTARAALAQCDAAMASLGQPNFAELAWTQASKLGEDVWHTQASMLIADAVLAESLRAAGCMPDIVAGHSFGEFAAMLAAGCWNLPTALRATWHRCQSIVDNAPAVCGMLSIQAAAEKVEAWIAASGAAVSLSHRNAPEQTVVGGKQSAVAQFAQFLENEAVASRLLAVPTAFHTPVLCGAQAPFARALEAIPLVPPRVGLLSSVSNRYVADPIEMRQGLVAQLVTPLDFVQLVQRLLSDGVGLMLEVGPQQVLTRLVRQIAGSRAMIVSTDHPKRDGLTQLACARACLEVMRRQPHASAPLDATLPIAARSQSSAPLAQPSSPQPAPLHFDATERRRERMRSAADAAPRATVPTSATAKPSPAALHYDASQNRRQRNRHPAFAGAEKLPEGRGVVQAVQPTDAGALASPPPDASAPPAAPTDPSVASASADSGRIIESFLIDFVVEQTGYPAEIIELDWDIEADLGIDSIKKAQLFGELREFFDLESLTNFSLDRFRSLRDIVELLKTTPGKGDWLERRLPAAGPSASAPAPTQAASNEAASNEAVQNQAEPNQAEPNQAAASHSPASEAAATADVGVPLNRPVAASQAVQNDAQQLQRFLIDFVVEQTGYPEEIVELDADLEADLGIDSIKKAQLFGELREMFDFQTSGAADKRMSLSEYRTLRSVLELLLSSVATSARLPDPPSPTPAASNGVAAAAASRMATRLASPPHADLQPKPNGQAYLEPQSFSQAQANAQASSHPLVQPRSQSQSRLPSERGIAPSSEPTSGQLPMAWLTRAGVAVDDYYAAATLANLNAMVGRPHRATDNVRLHYNGAQRRVEQDVARLAVATQTAELSLLALDACLAAQMQWRPLQPAASSPNDSTASTSMMPILEAIAPSWLSSGGGVPLAIHLRQSPDASATIELLAPGCNISSTLVTHNGFLLAGGQLEPNRDEHAQLQLVDWLHQQTNQLTSLPQFDAAARKLKLAGDWWLMAVDLHSAQRVLIESRDGLIVIEKGALTSAPKADACLIDCAARIWLDPAGRALVIEAQQTAVPRLPHRLAIPLDNLQPWLAQPGPAGQSTSDDSQSSQAPDAIKNVDIDFDSDADAHANVNANADGAAEALTRRFVLRMVLAPQRPTSGRRPAWSGTALVIGDNPVATQLEARLRGANVPVVRWSGATDPEALAKRFDELASEQAIRHLFLTTPCDAAAHSTLDRSAWQRRRNEGLMSLFWLCQRWHEHVTSSGWVDDASLVAVTSMGGDFGVGGNLHSIEGGGLTGLLKSILIESWVRGFRTFPIKILDTSREDSPAQIVDHIWDELAVPSFDIEVAYPQGERHVVRAIPQPLSSANATATGLSSGSLTGRGGRIGEARSIAPAGPHRRQLSRGAAWVCTGGARGITAYVVEQLAARYQLKVHLLGTAPLPVAQASARELDEQALRSLKAEVMTSARTAGKNPITTWQDTEKALEIARNLQRFERLGIEAHYHQCDVSDREQVREVLERVRAISGPIRGVLHGAGVGKDARFDRKQPDKVNQCIGAKVDGAWSLIEATWNDPLETFVGFGSISGRFGANGHTDYSLANDMLCKQMDWLRSARPEVHAVGFHWHAWGDVGMATKPETRLALEMIQMQFMPAAEGVRHLIRELESDRCESEVLITDDRYYRLFTSPDPSRDSAGRSLEHRPPATPLLCPADQQTRTTDAVRLHTATLDPVKDPFLAEHRLDDAPLLPIVVGAELLLEGARAHLGHVARLKLCQLEAVQGLRFFSDQPQTVKVATSLDEHGHIDSRLLSDFRARDGRLVQSDRLHIAGRVEVASGVIDRVTRIALPLQAVWNRPLYPAPGSKFFVGPSLQRLRGFAIVGESLVGRIIAPALIELAGGGRDVRGWQLPSAAVDACLFAAGILAWQVVAPGSALPAGFGEIEIGRLPLPGEACEVHVRLRSHNVGAPPSEATNSLPASPAEAVFDFTLYGVDNDVLVNVREYRVAWLVERQASKPQSSATLTS